MPLTSAKLTLTGQRGHGHGEIATPGPSGGNLVSRTCGQGLPRLAPTTVPMASMSAFTLSPCTAPGIRRIVA